MKSDLKKWLKEDGEVFIKEIGIRKRQTVLDFGCGEGHYTFPVAKAVGEKGKVYAVDKTKKVLNKLIKIAQSERLKNIEPIKTSGKVKIPLADESVNVLLLCDVFHSYYFGANERRELLEEIYRISKDNVLISVCPKHRVSKSVIKEMKRANFRLEKKLFKRLIIHGEPVNKGRVLNFRKE